MLHIGEVSNRHLRGNDLALQSEKEEVINQNKATMGVTA